MYVNIVKESTVKTIKRNGMIISPGSHISDTVALNIPFNLTPCLQYNDIFFLKKTQRLFRYLSANLRTITYMDFDESIIKCKIINQNIPLLNSLIIRIR